MGSAFPNAVTGGHVDKRPQGLRRSPKGSAFPNAVTGGHVDKRPQGA